MRWSDFYLFTTREDPADAEVVSHRLMVRSGMLRKLAAGIYTYQPLGWRSMRKLMEIVRRELEVAGCVELSMPAVQPAELWQESGRWQKYGKELLRFEDRHQRGFCFGPTHEEVITDLVRRDVSSYRQLPLSLFQIQTKFRDEIRPRFGLMRGREFLMKDAYSFHADGDSLDEAYRALHDAYVRIFEACELDYIVVEADSGTIGGSSSHEFMVLADTGEDAVLFCKGSGYAANVEKATTRLAPPPPLPALEEPEAVDTPDAGSIGAVTKLLGVEPAQTVKTLVYESDKGFFAVAIRGDRTINEIKLKNVTDSLWIQLAEAPEVERLTGAALGYAGPCGLPDEVQLLVDESAAALQSFVCGANRTEVHLRGVQWQRDVGRSRTVDVLLAEPGDPCPRSGQALEGCRGIEVGHIFKLGTVYSSAMGCTFADENGQEQPMEMGCYGLGIGRTVAAAIEQNHDDDGISWPLPLAPFTVLLAALNPKDEAVVRTAEELYEQLRRAGHDVLYDDRDERPGVKFKDADLIGIPVRVVVGARSLEAGGVEFSLRSDREKRIVAVDELLAEVGAVVGGSSRV
ncbi:MAG: proline--tRNA ligase [Acidobacteria bacterium]|nr:MAG: proline--tRNA ligase [Acidobacteriota bacterium]REK12140.1 MAG: proline--tRNA ligase [Acidobacteriota bacterium]